MGLLNLDQSRRNFIARLVLSDEWDLVVQILAIFFNLHVHDLPKYVVVAAAKAVAKDQSRFEISCSDFTAMNPQELCNFLGVEKITHTFRRCYNSTTKVYEDIPNDLSTVIF